MKALCIDDIGHAEFRDIDHPTLDDNQVLLKVLKVGLCGSDLNTFRGANPLVKLPRVPGHEIGGTIVATGSNAPSEFEKGKAAIVIPYTTCGECRSCKSGRVNACRYNKTLGVQQDGGLSDYIAIRPDRLILNDTLEPDLLALVEPLSVGFHAVNRGSVTATDTVLVLGGGMIGAGAILGAKARGANVLVAEISDEKTETLKKLGVEHIINPSKVNIVEAANELTNGHGVNVVIEAVGAAETFRSAIDLVCFAGRVVYIGYAKSDVSYNTSLFNLKELDIFGSRNAVREDFEAVISYLEKNGALAKTLISKRFNWNNADQAFDYWVDNKERVFKIIIDLESAN